MSEDFDAIDAPQFFDFSHPHLNEQEADCFFGPDSTNDVFISDPQVDPLRNSQHPINNESQQNGSKNSSIYSSDENGELPQQANIYCNPRRNFRRSMSVGDIFYLENAIKNAELRESTDDSVASSNTETTHKGERVKHFPNKLMFHKRHYGSDRNLPSSSYVPMAEAVRRFHASTPERFHSRAKTENLVVSSSSRLTSTIPQSPHLISNKRHRPVNIIPQKEKELQEFEEAQKHKFKAHPVDKKILLGPAKLPTNIEKKPPTIPEPFNLAKVKPKVAASPPKREEPFHAKPAPDFSIRPQLKKPLQKFTKAETPTFLKRYQKAVEKPPAQPEPKKALPRPKKALALPYSFEARNQYLLQRKETFVKNFIEEEKKAREFHARPIAKGVLEPPKIGVNTSTKTIELRSKTMELRSRSASEENLNLRKETRPKTCVEIKKKPLTEIQEFNLNTELRARERQLFEQELKAKQEKMERFKQIAEERRLQEEQEEIQQLRKMAEVKAQPIRKYKNVVVAPSCKVTEPISPKFYKSVHSTQDSKLLEDKENNSV